MKDSYFLPGLGPASSNTDRPNASYLVLALPLLTLTDPAPTSYLGPILTPQVVLTDSYLIFLPSPPTGTLTGPVAHT